MNKKSGICVVGHCKVLDIKYEVKDLGATCPECGGKWAPAPPPTQGYEVVEEVVNKLYYVNYGPHTYAVAIEQLAFYEPPKYNIKCQGEALKLSAEQCKEMVEKVDETRELLKKSRANNN